MAGVPPDPAALSVPILAVVFILAFIGSITEVPMASILLQDEQSDPGGRGPAGTSIRRTTCGVTSPQPPCCQASHHGRLPARPALAGGGLTAGGVKG